MGVGPGIGTAKNFIILISGGEYIHFLALVYKFIIFPVHFSNFGEGTFPLFPHTGGAYGPRDLWRNFHISRRKQERSSNDLVPITLQNKPLRFWPTWGYAHSAIENEF